MTPPVVRADVLDGIAHGFLGRQGGISTGLVASLNAGLGADDDPGAVAVNRARALAAVAPGRVLVTPYQTHSSDVVIVTRPWSDDARPRADALVTERPGIALSVVTADCAPVLLADRTAGVVGAAHAGWKGALGGVLSATVEAMRRLGARPERIAAAIGPCIGQASYEVDEAFRARFVAADGGFARFFAPGRPGHGQFDLAAFAAARLHAAGVGNVAVTGQDTLAQPQAYFSFRRATLAGEPDYGRQISLIAL